MSDHLSGIVPDLDFEQYTLAPGVSNSHLKIIHEQTPLHLRYHLDAPPKPPTDAQRFGSLVHGFLLQPDTMKDAFYVKPDGMKFSTKEGKAWQDEHEGKPILTAEEATAIDCMVAAVHRHPSASRLLKNAELESSIFVRDSQDTLRKLRPDVLPNGGDYLPDVKTCDSAAPDDFAKAVANYGYYRQAAYYLDGCELAGRKYEAFVFIAVEKTPPYAVAVHRLTPYDVDLGRLHYQRALAIYRECLASGHWPGYRDDIGCIDLPAWMQKDAELSM